MGFCSDRCYKCVICVQNSKIVALPIPEIIESTQKRGQPLGMATLFCLPNFNGFLVRIDPVKVPAKFEVHSFTNFWDNSNWNFVWGLQTPNCGVDEALGGRI